MFRRWPEPDKKQGVMGTENYKKILILCAVLAAGIIGVSVLFALKNDEPKTHKTQTGSQESGELTPEEPEKQEVMIKEINEFLRRIHRKEFRRAFCVSGEMRERLCLYDSILCFESRRNFSE